MIGMMMLVTNKDIYTDRVEDLCQRCSKIIAGATLTMLDEPQAADVCR
jgi:hypothetical protein